MENIENRELFQYDLNTVKGNREAWDNKKKIKKCFYSNKVFKLMKDF